MITKVESVEQFIVIVKQHNPLKSVAFQAVDLSDYDDVIFDKDFEDCLFLGCEMSTKAQKKLIKTGNLFFPKMNLPFQMYRSKLYGHTELYDSFSYTDPSTYTKTNDYLVYKYYASAGKAEPTSIKDSLAQRLHDHSITDSLYE